MFIGFWSCKRCANILGSHALCRTFSLPVVQLVSIFANKYFSIMLVLGIGVVALVVVVVIQHFQIEALWGTVQEAVAHIAKLHEQMPRK